ncbi:hypothetical protein GCM10009853_078010 [Glycomyces scopariae]
MDIAEHPRRASAGAMIGRATVRAASDGGEAHVTVDLAGAVVGVGFGPASRGMREVDLAAHVLAAYERAAAQAARLAAELPCADPGCPPAPAGAH